MMYEARLSGGPLGGRIYAVEEDDTEITFDVPVSSKPNDTRKGTYKRVGEPINKGAYKYAWQGLDDEG